MIWKPSNRFRGTQTKDMQRQEGAAPQHIAIHQVAATPNRSFTSDAQGGSADLSPEPRAAHTQQTYPFDTWRASHPDPASETLCSGPGPGLEALRRSESRRSRVSVMTLPLFHAPDR